MAHVCILYAIENQAFATKIERALFEMNHSVSRREVDEDACAILGVAGGEPEAMIVIWSAASIASPTLIAHARSALARRTLTPVAIGKIEPPQSFQHLWPIDLSGWTGVLDDPRWRFVTDEINLSVHRSEMSHEETTPAAITPEPAKNISARTVLLGGGAALAVLTLGLVAAAPVLFGKKSNPEPPSVAFIEPSGLEQTEGAPPTEQIEPPASTVQGAADAQPLSDEDTQAGEETTAAQTPPELMAVRPVLAENTAGETIDNSVDDAVSAGDAGAGAEQPPPPLPSGIEQSAPFQDSTPSQTIAQADEARATDASPDEAALQTGATSRNTDIADPAPVLRDETITIASAPTATAPTDISPIETASDQSDAATPRGQDMPAPSLKPGGQETPAMETAGAAEPVATAAAQEPIIVAAAASTTAAAPTFPENDADGLDRLIVENTLLAEQESPAYPGNYFRECVACPDMAALPGGAFIMGTPIDERARADTELPSREVSIPYRYAIGTREVTFEQWDACVTEGGCRNYRAADPGWGRGKRPVVNVSWEDAQSYVDWLSHKTGQDYRLPTEAEWEYAARSGAATPFAHGAGIDTRLANYNGGYRYGGPKGVYRKQTTLVASFPPNAFGLFDMHGNVWEWTADCWSQNPEATPTDCSIRVLKGGAWNSGAWRLRAGHRIAGDQQVREFDNGFRVARTLP